MSKDLFYISTQPATNYYAWQVEVYLDNFKKNEVNMSNVHVLLAIDDSTEFDNWMELKKKHPDVGFFFYHDTRQDKIYAPSVQPHINKKHLKRFPELANQAVFYHDCDMILNNPFDMKEFIDSEVCYMSNVRSYIGPEYIKSKGIGLLEMMALQVGICDCKIYSEAENTGGAQRLLKGANYEYWNQVEIDSVKLYRWLINNKDRFGNEEVNSLQIWTSGMWSELWNLWKMNKQVSTPREFDFCWATCDTGKIPSMNFMHNAGATHGNRLFVKSDFINKNPYNSDVDIDKSKCSYFYYNEVKKSGLTSTLTL